MFSIGIAYICNKWLGALLFVMLKARRLNHVNGNGKSWLGALLFVMLKARRLHHVNGNG